MPSAERPLSPQDRFREVAALLATIIRTHAYISDPRAQYSKGRMACAQIPNA